MISILAKPFIVVWEALVRRQRRNVHSDPDVVELREQQRDAMEANRRLNIIEQQYLKGANHDRPTQ